MKDRATVPCVRDDRILLVLFRWCSASHNRTANNEIVEYRWFTPVKIATLFPSVPTGGIVQHFLRHIGILALVDVRRP